MPKLYKEEIKRFFLKDDPNKAFLDVVYLEPHQISIVSDAITTQVMIQDADGNLERRAEIDRGKDREETAVLAVRDWGGYFDADGNEMECSEANKRFWAHDPEFMVTLNGFRKILGKEVAEKRKVAAKN